MILQHWLRTHVEVTLLIGRYLWACENVSLPPTNVVSLPKCATERFTGNIFVKLTASVATLSFDSPFPSTFPVQFSGALHGGDRLFGTERLTQASTNSACGGREYQMLE